MGFEGGVRRRPKRNRSKLARSGFVFLAVAAADGALIYTLDLTGSPIRATRTAADQSAPYYLTTERRPRPAPKARAAEARPLKRRKAQTSPAAAPPPSPEPNVPPSSAAAPPSVPAGPPAPNYGRWTVAPGAWPEAGRGGNAMSACDPAKLASLPEGARRACAERLRSASAAGPPAPRGAAPDWKEHNLLTSCNERKNEPAHKWLLDHCSPVGGTAVGITLKYKF